MSWPLKKALVWSIGLTAALGLAFAWVARERLRDLAAGNELQLTSIDGPFDLSQVRGRAAVIYFGFTQCPDVCPLSMNKLRDIFSKLSSEERSRVVPIFVSVDHRTDTPEIAARYIRQFFSDGVGLTGTKEQIDRATKNFGTTYTLEDAPHSPIGYVITHGDSFFVMSRQGKLSEKISTQSSREQVLEAIRKVI